MADNNDKKPGLHLVKVDSADPSKVIPNVVFEIEGYGVEFGPEEFTTDENGEIDLSKLEPGTYRVTEKLANGYVIDDAQRIIHLEPGQTGEVVFTNSIKPSLRLVKLTARLWQALRSASPRSRMAPITWTAPPTRQGRSW